MGSLSKAELDALVADAIVDCYDEDEQISGLYTKIEDNLALPFHTQVLGVDVTVEDIELKNDRCIVAFRACGGIRQAIPVLELPLPGSRA